MSYEEVLELALALGLLLESIVATAREPAGNEECTP